MQTSALPSLLDDAGLLAELEQFERLPKLAVEEQPITDAQLDEIAEINPRRPVSSPAPAFDDDVQRRARAALERALEPEYHEQHQNHEHPHAHAAQARVPRAVVVLVTVMGLAFGAGMAGVMFHDRVIQVVDRLHLK